MSLRDIHEDDVDYFASIFIILFPPLQRLKLFATSLDSSWRLTTTSATAEDLLIARQLLSHFLGLLSTPTQILRRIHWPARPPRPMGTVFGPPRPSPYPPYPPRPSRKPRRRQSPSHQSLPSPAADAPPPTEIKRSPLPFPGH